ncbi:hypothetical protein P885DRAFT_26459 [Corynascus similis CBS 632.67]
MAANMPQMVANGQMMLLQQQQQQQQQQQHSQQQQSRDKQIQNLVYSNLMQSMGLAPLNSWQSGVSIGDRFAKTINLVSNTLLAYPSPDWQKFALTAIEHEKKLFLQSPDRQSYDHAMAGKTAEMVKRRQENATELQNHVNNDAARQAQLQAAQRQQQQMMMNQMAARGLGQPQQHGFQPMQNPMQVPVMPQQPQQIGMGMPTAGMLQNQPTQRQFPMQIGQARQPAVFQLDPLAQLAQQDKARVNSVAMKLMAAADEQQKNNIRQLLQQKMTPAQLQEYAAQGKDPLFTFYQNNALNQLRAQAQRNLMQQQQQQQQQQQRAGVPGSMMRQAPNQGPMNPALIGSIARQPVMPDGQTFPPNMDDIRNEQQMGLLAQQAGQTVVPASSAPGRNATPAAMAGMPPQARPGNQQGPNQTPRPPQVQSFGMPDPSAAQVQAQQGVRAVAGRGMPGQPGTMAAPAAPTQASQSPGMNTLNAPMRQPPIPMGQGNGHPVNQANPPMAATLNPQFNHQNNTRPQSLQGNMNNPAAMAGAMPNLGPDGAMRNFYAQLQDRAGNSAFQGPKPGLMPGMPGTSQPGPMGGPNQAGVVDANQKGNGLMQSAAQPAMGQQPKPMPSEKDQQFNAFVQSPQGRAAMSNMDVPAQILQQLRGTIPAETRKWAQLRQFLQANPGVVPGHLIGRLGYWQTMQFRQAWEKRQQAAAGMTPQNPTGPVPQQPGFHAPPLPPGVSYPPNIMQVTRQDIENVRRNAQFANMPDEFLIEVVKKYKRDIWAKRAWEQYNQAQQQRNSMNLAGGAQKQGSLTAQPTPGQPGSVSGAASQPNISLGVQQAPQPTQPKPPVAPVPEMPAAPAKGVRQPPNPSPASAAKSLKRPNPEDANDMAGQPTGAAQRPTPQPETRVPSAITKPTMEQLMKLSPEQLAKIPQEQLAKLTPDQQRAISMRIRQGQAAPAVPQEAYNRLKSLAQEGHRLAIEEMKQQEAQQQPGFRITMSSPMFNETRLKLTQVADKIKWFRRPIARWYLFTKDDARAKMFFKIRSKVSKQFVDNDQMSQLPESLTITKDELDQYINMLDSMVQDIEMINKKSAGQAGAGAGAPAAGQLPPQPSPLSAANLEKQTQALKQAQNRTATKTAQPPAAPTTSQPPFQFGIQKSSPAGNPEYLGEQRITQANLVIPPARKKAKTGAGQASPPMVQQQTPNMSSPQVNAPSPVATRKPEPPKLRCLEPGCETNSIGFATEEALNAHHQEEHIIPFENPFGFLQEQMTAAFGLDAQGNPKTSPKPGPQGVPTPAATPMSISRSKQGQKPGATPMSRAGSMQRQGSTAGAKLGENVGTPGRNSGIKQGAGTPQVTAPEDPWLSSTVDPQDLFSGLGSSLEAVTGTLVPDFGTYRSLTPNDTPESSKDSGTSETTSDIAETAALDIDLQMQPLDNDLLFDMTNINMENFGSPSMELDMDLFTNESLMFPLDDMQNDFSKPFRVDRELYSTDL